MCVFGVFHDVVYLDDAPLFDRAPDCRAAAKLRWIGRAIGAKTRRKSKHRDIPEAAVDEPLERTLVGATQSNRGLRQRVEHRLQIESRAADDLEHIGGRRLLLQRLVEFRRAGLHFLEQAGILDGDDRLVGERPDQIDVFVGERLDLGTAQHEHADRTSLSHQRHAQHRPEPDPVRRLQERVFRVGKHVGHLHDLVIEQYPPLHGAASRRQALVLGVRQPIGREIVVSGVVVAFRLLPSDCGHIRLAKLRGRLGERIEHCLQIERRAADDFQHVRRCRLLLQRLAQFGGARLHLVEQADVLDGDHGLVGEGLDKLDLAIRERPTPAGSRRRRRSAHLGA